MTIDDIFRAYSEKWDHCTIKQEFESDVHRVAIRVIANEKLYRLAEEKTKTPWFLIAAIHNLESSLDFSTCLHNGQPWNRTTTKVPKGLGPWTSWLDAAVDCLKRENLTGPKDWTLEMCLYQAEIHNGMGYIKYHPSVPSPYLWAKTSISTGHGKYVADGKFDPAARNDDQVGVAALFKWLEASGFISFTRANSKPEINQTPQAPTNDQTINPPATPPPTAPKINYPTVFDPWYRKLWDWLKRLFGH